MYSESEPGIQNNPSPRMPSGGQEHKLHQDCPSKWVKTAGQVGPINRHKALTLLTWPAGHDEQSAVWSP